MYILVGTVCAHQHSKYTTHMFMKTMHVNVWVLYTGLTGIDGLFLHVFVDDNIFKQETVSDMI